MTRSAGLEWRLPKGLYCVSVAGRHLRLDANLGWLFTEFPFERRFEAAASSGFTGVEYARPYDHSPAFLQKCLRDVGLRQVLINAPVGDQGSPSGYGTACHPDAVSEFRRGVLTALEYAVALDSDLIHIPGGTRPEGVSRDLAFSTYVTNIAWALERVADTNVTVVLEAINRRDAPRFVLDSVDQAAAVVRAVGTGQLGLLFDIYHCQISGGDITMRLRELLPVIAHMQIADVPGRGEPGTGEIAWGFVFDQIRTLGYAGWIGCEYRPTKGTPDSLTWREEFGIARPADG
jgi:hydroxypyruvate isomerase